MFKNHDSGIITLSLFTAFTSLFFLARHYFTNDRQMRWSCEGKYTIAMCMCTYRLQCTTYIKHIYFVHRFYIYQSITDSVCAMYRLYIGNTYVAYSVCSVYTVYSLYIINI